MDKNSIFRNVREDGATANRSNKVMNKTTTIGAMREMAVREAALKKLTWNQKLRQGLLGMYEAHTENIEGGDLPAQSMERLKRALSFDFNDNQITELLTMGKTQYLLSETGRRIKALKEENNDKD